MKLCLAAGKIAKVTNCQEMRAHLARKRWRLFDPQWVEERLRLASKRGYENDVATFVSKLLLRRKTGGKDDASKI
jgi:hypothetical protein